MTNEKKKEYLHEETMVKIGKYLIAEMGDKGLGQPITWIQNEAGEGTSVSTKEFELLLEEFFNKNF